jgi:chemotaxis protein methyltransferase CheR
VNLSINEIKEITHAMLSFPNMDYTNYTISFLKRRLSFVFEQLNIKRKDQFLDQLKNAEFRDRVVSNLVVENTELFRDPAFWRMLRDKIVNQLHDNSVIWLPNESSGEEAYSVSLILYEKKAGSKFKIFCNNPAAERCQSIMLGQLNGKHFELNQSNYKRLEEYDAFGDHFTLENNHMRVSDALRNQIVCQHGTISQTIPKGDVSLILFRNEAIYYNHRLANTVFNQLYEKLMPGGYLAIGVKEQLPESIADRLKTIDEAEKIYQKPIVGTNGF